MNSPLLWPRNLGVLLIKGYQRLISPGLPPTCRFYPSCSQYTLEAVSRYGLVRGSWLGTKRLVRCHPFNPGGFDPVPDNTTTDGDSGMRSTAGFTKS